MDSKEKLINIFRNFPTVGPRTAGRFVYYLMKLPKEKIDELTNALQELKNKVRFCEFCFNPFETIPGSEEKLCSICKNPSRNKEILCVVEKEMDLETIEKTKKYNGLYFILNINNPRFEELKAKVREKKFAEIIVALNPTQEGRATSVLVERALKEVPQSPMFKITHLAQGIPVGGELEYADDETLESAFEGRK